jgi:hypothetical protein
VQGDLERINVDPNARAALFLQYSKDKMVEPTI